MSKFRRVMVWNENRHEHQEGKAAEVYPAGLHAPIVDHLQGLGFQVRTATLDEPQHGLTEQSLKDTDVLVWWGH